MELGIINSAFAQAGKGTEFGLEQIARLGFDTVDIFTDPLDIDTAERQLIPTAAKRLGLPIRSICCVALGLIDLNPSVQRFHLDRCRAFIDLCAEFQARNLLLVLGEYIWQQEVIPPAEQWRWAVENTTLLGDYAKTRGVQIVIELEPFRASLINTVDTMLKFLADVNLPGVVEANCDLSHLYLMGIGPDQIARLGPRIEHVHLSDCDGKVHGDLPPGRGVVPLIDYVRALKAAGYDKTISIELEYSPQPQRIVEWVEEAYMKTAAIMDAAGCRG
ncbi:MAG: TIM barrel protein [Planctomycetes bacterium]|nr:TIM barrel protein [Planctomycetota bacterium]